MQNSDKQAATATVGAATSTAVVKYLPLGSVSSGTMREEDLIPAFLRALETVDVGRAAALRTEFTEIESNNENEEERNEWRRDLLDTLFDVLDAHCPPFCRFGAHPGDGADYGVWVCEESLADAVDEDEVHLVLPGGEWLARPDGGGLDYAVYDAGDGDFRKLVDARTGAVIWSV